MAKTCFLVSMMKLFLFRIFLLSLIHTISPSIAITNIITDQSALLALKSHITHDPQNLLATNWSTSTPVCKWVGVTCGLRHQRVTVLNVSYFGLTGTIPPHIGNLSFLTELRFKNNSFHGSLPIELTHLRRLKLISFGYNNFMGGIPSWIWSLSKLEWLGLYGNQFSGSITKEIGNAAKLRELWLYKNHLTGDMADVMSHGGDAGGDPPHPGSSHVPSQCESSQPRRRGDSKGIRLQQLFNANGRRPLRVHFDWVEGTLQPIGEFHELVTRFVSSHIKHNVGPHHESWESVDAHLKEQLLNAVERYFDLRYNHTEDQYHYVRLGINRMAQDRYRDYKYKVHQHFKLKGADEPYKKMSGEVWKKCVERFTSQKFLERSKKNESNRSKAKYPSSQGTKSFSASRYDMRNRETEEWPTLVSSWKTFHTNKKGEWVNATAAQDYARLEEELQTQTQEATSSGTEVDERAVTRRVLGERRGHEKGVGRILKGLSGSRSRTSCGAGSSSSGPTQEEFAAMQAQFAAIQAQSEQYRSFAAMQQQFMTNLLGQLQTTVPNFHLDVPFPVFPNLNEPLNPTPNPHQAVTDNQEEEEDDENLGDD